MSVEPTSTREPGRTDAGAQFFPILLFLATVWSVFHAGALLSGEVAPRGPLVGLFDPKFLVTGASFALPLLAILVTHELGHYVAARWHGLPASLPYFIPLPLLGFFGTLGALIGMHDDVRSRNALLDVGASGPLAGLVIAIPTVIWGLAHSHFAPQLSHGYLQEGSSLFYLFLERVVVGPAPKGYDLMLHPTALAGWAGLWLTMLNLFWWGQLDGGHVAYALLGERHHALARWSRRALLALFAYNVIRFVIPVLRGETTLGLRDAISNSSFWLVWFVVLHVVERASGESQHPPYDPGPLSPWRKVVGWLCMALFALLFMPTPLAQY